MPCRKTWARLAPRRASVICVRDAQATCERRHGGAKAPRLTSTHDHGCAAMASPVQRQHTARADIVEVKELWRPRRSAVSAVHRAPARLEAMLPVPIGNGDVEP